jgi:hypothetical protein
MKLSIDLTPEEVDTLHRYSGMINTMKHLVPAALSSVLTKVEEAIKEVGNGTSSS